MNNDREKCVKINVYDNQYDNLKKKEIQFTNNENENENENENQDENDDNDYENEDMSTEWQEYHENILIDWADKAMCYRWLHSKSCIKYTFLRNVYTIPVIILSTLTGTANFALERIPEEYQGVCQIAIGSFNILAGIITTISQFLKINELSEAHRVSSISWDKFYRNIRVELVKSPKDRTNVSYLIKLCKDEYDRLMETSPNIDAGILKKFNKTFKMNSKINQKTRTETIKTISKPEILDSFESTRNIVYKENEKDIQQNSLKNKKMNVEKENMVNDFVKTFEKEYSRKPSIYEIYDNLDNKVSTNIIQKFLSKNKNK